MRRLVPIAGSLVAGLVLAGCAAAYPGSAARVGDTRIPEETIATQLEEINTTLGLPADAPSARAATGLVSANAQIELVSQMAASENINISAAAVDAAVTQQAEAMGGPERMEAAMAQQLIAPDNIRPVLQANLVLVEVGKRALPDGDPQAQFQAAQQSFGNFASAVDVEVAPRYGVWSPEVLSAVPPVDGVTVPGAPLQNILPGQGQPQ